MSPFSSIEEAVQAFKAGRMIVVVDDEERENEGDLVVAAEKITEEQMALIIRHTGGVVCLALHEDIANALDLPPMVQQNTSHFGTHFTVSIEAAHNVTTGISAHDRVETVRAAMQPHAVPSDLARPGHVFPLRARKGGVLVRAGHTEAAVDLAGLAGLSRGAVLSELMHDDGTVMRLPALEAFAKEHGFPLVSIADLIAYRKRHETLVQLEATSTLETDTGSWRIHVYKDRTDGKEHVALVQGMIRGDTPVLVRVHSECLTGDLFHSRHCDCGWQLQRAMELIHEEGSGILLYMRQEGRGIGLINKIRAYDLQQREKLDTVEANTRLGLAADLRDYGIGAQILQDLGVHSLRLLTNNPKKIAGLAGFGLAVTEQIPIEIETPSLRQQTYLSTKKGKMGHTLRI